MKTIHAPFGRMQEHVGKLSDADKQRAAIKHGKRLGDDDTLKIFPSREFMARMIRRAEQAAPCAEWKPVVKLTDGEGY